MATKARALGRLFDVGWGGKPQLLNASGVTGKNISLQNPFNITAGGCGCTGLEGFALLAFLLVLRRHP